MDIHVEPFVLTSVTTDSPDARVTSFLWTVKTTKDLSFSHNFWICLFMEDSTNASACTDFFNITSTDAGIRVPSTATLTTQTQVILSLIVIISPK